MKNKVFSLAELRREAKGQKIKFEMIERYGKTGEAIPERLRGIREVVLCQEKVQIKYALLMLSYPAKASALSSNAA